MPTAFLSGILLWKQHPWGYLLSSIVLVKGFTMLLVVSATAANMALAGVQVSIGEAIMFPLLALIDIGVTVILFKNINKARCYKRLDRAGISYKGASINE